MSFIHRCKIFLLPSFAILLGSCAAQTVIPSAVLPTPTRTLYVSPFGKDTNDGLSPQTAFKLPQKAADISQPGDQILFAEGTYEIKEGRSPLRITRSGEADKPIVYAPMQGAKVTIYNSGAWEAIKVSGARHIEIRGLRIQGHNDLVTLEEAQREMSNLKNPRTSDNGIGIVADSATKTPSAYITVRDCEIFNCGGGGLFTNHSDYLTFENNVVYRCGFWSPYANSGISVYQPIDVDDSTNYKIVIRGNVSFENYNFIPFYHSNKANPELRKVTDGNGIIIDDFLSSQSWGGGVSKPYQGRALVANNIVFDNGGSGIHAFKSTNTDIVHNYAANNNRHPDRKDGQIFANSSKHIRLLNNIMVAPTGKPVNSDYKNEDVVYDYNLYASTDGGQPKFVLAKANNVVALPNLVLPGWNQGQRALKVGTQSPLVAAGVPLPEMSTDFFGVVRSTKTPDIGPFVLKGVAKSPSIASVSVQAQSQPQSLVLIENGDFGKGKEFWDIHSFSKQKLKAEFVNGPQEGTQALRVTTDAEEKLQKYTMGATQAFQRDVAAGETLTLRFMARSLSSNTIAAMIHQPKAPYRRVFYKEYQLTPDWKSYEVIGKSSVGFAQGDVELNFFLSFAPGQVELAQVEVTSER